MASEGTLFGYGVHSAFTHRRLAPAPAVRGTLEVRRGDAVAVDPARVIHHDDGDGGSFTIAREPDGALHVICAVAGGFRLEPGRALVVADGACADADVWEHRVATVVIPLLLAERGDIALHAAALARHGRAVAFAGASTRGKSTLALVAAAAGLPVIADDSIVIEQAATQALVWPGPTGVRVAPPGEARKRTLDGGEAPQQPCPLAAIVILGERTHGEAELTPVVPVEALPALVPSLVFAGRDRLGVAMRQAAWLASAVPVLRCRLPEGIERLPAAIDEVLGVILPAAGVSPAGA